MKYLLLAAALTLSLPLLSTSPALAKSAGSSCAAKMVKQCQDEAASGQRLPKSVSQCITKRTSKRCG